MILIAMAGGSSRFFNEGYTVPKYELPIGDKTLFDLTLESFKNYFDKEHFLFVAKKEFNASSFVEKRCQILGINSFNVVEIEGLTRGQAESVFLGLAGVDESERLTIFNIDTIRNDFKYPLNYESMDGFLEVFEGEGSNWSFASCIEGTERVIQTSEKVPISNLCSNGLYYFATVKLFREAYGKALESLPEYLSTWRELYIAPLYNYLIVSGKNIYAPKVSMDKIIFSGTPKEYQDLLRDKI